MNVLCVGDVVGKNGCEALRKNLPALKKLKGIDLTIVNGENSATGNGILPGSAEHIFTSGADVITTGNHVFRRHEIYSFLEENDSIVRPANFPESAPGKGMCIVDMGRTVAAVINIMGVTYMEPLKNPFETADAMIDKAKAAGAKLIFVDVHAEATAEKRALGFYLDGRVTALFGTHTHVQTSDAEILPQGTGYITDLGMCGPRWSVLGVKPELAIQKMKNMLPVRFDNADGESVLGGCIFEVDEKTGKTIGAEAVTLFC